MLSDVRAQGAQGRENALVVGIIRAQLESIFARDGKRHLEQINRVESKALAKQPHLGIQRIGWLVEIDGLNDQACHFVFKFFLRHQALVPCPIRDDANRSRNSARTSGATLVIDQTCRPSMPTAPRPGRPLTDLRVIIRATLWTGQSRPNPSDKEISPLAAASPPTTVLETGKNQG